MTLKLNMPLFPRYINQLEHVNTTSKVKGFNMAKDSIKTLTHLASMDESEVPYTYVGHTDVSYGELPEIFLSGTVR